MVPISIFLWCNASHLNHTCAFNVHTFEILTQTGKLKGLVSGGYNGICCGELGISWQSSNSRTPSPEIVFTISATKWLSFVSPKWLYSITLSTHTLSHSPWPTGNVRELSWQPFSNTSVCVCVSRRDTAGVGGESVWVCVCAHVRPWHGGYRRWFSISDAIADLISHWQILSIFQKVSMWWRERRGGGRLRGMDNECDVWKTTQSISFISCLRRNLMSSSIFISSQ